jgi:hypothetical protein
VTVSDLFFCRGAIDVVFCGRDHGFLVRLCVVCPTTASFSASFASLASLTTASASFPARTFPLALLLALDVFFMLVCQDLLMANPALEASVVHFLAIIVLCVDAVSLV